MIYSLAFPEILMSVVGLFSVLWVAFRGEKSFKSTNIIIITSFIISIFLLFVGENGTTFNNLFSIDPFRQFVKIMLLIASVFTLIISSSYLCANKNNKSEYPILILFSTLGMMIMISANDLMSLYMGLELQNIALYVLVSMKKNDSKSSEAGLKYFILSASSSCVLLFGMSLIYGFASSTNFDVIENLLSQNISQMPAIAVGLTLVIAGFAFKVSSAPFHMWAPDVYEGSLSSVTAFLATAPKIAALSLLAIILSKSFINVSGIWQPVLILLSIISMLVGSFGGLLQTNIKRLMAYSSIANVGTLLIGLVVVGANVDNALRINGLNGFLLYLTLYFVGTFGVFSILTFISKGNKQIEKIDDLAGLSKKHPILAGSLALCIFSLAGIPPLAGFFGKYFVLLSAVKANMLLLALIGVLTSVIAAGFYLRIVKVMYFDAQSDSFNYESKDILHMCSIGIFSLFVLMFFIRPSFLMQIIQTSVESILGS